MDPLELLVAEHEVILQVARVAAGEAAAIQEGQGVQRERVSQILDFIRTFADACHHGKEEDLLFPALESCGFSREVGPLAVMLVEHQQGRALVRQAAQALETAAGGDRQAADEVARALADWAQLIEQHIAKENQVLFPMAQEVLGEGTLRELGEAFNRLEQERFAGVHQRGRQLARELARTER